MDLPTTANTVATLTGLMVSFFSERRADKEASVDEFKAWLASERHDDIVRLLESNMSTVVGVKAMLHQSQGQVLNLLNEIKLKLDGPAVPERSGDVEVREDDVEVIVLGEGNAFIGEEGDIEKLSTRCAIKVIEGKRPIFDIRLAPTVLSSEPADPLAIPKYEAARAQAAKHLSARLDILTSPGVYEWWSYFLGGQEQWSLAVKSLVGFARLNSSFIAGDMSKIDLWRTADPKLSAPMYLSPSEVGLLLDHLGFSSTSDLRFGPHWRSAIDLPFNLIAQHAIPRVIAQLELRGVHPAGEVLNLLNWHIGEG